MTPPPSKRGQIFVVLAFLLAGLCLLLALNLDVFAAIRGKTRAQNAADAAALAAARWQGKTLNLLGELNLAHLEAVAESNLTAAAGISALQERLAYAAPMMGMIAASGAARENGAPPDPEMAEIIRAVRLMAGTIPNTDTWATKAADYQRMLEAVLDDGIYVGCENASIISLAPNSPAMLLQKDFYRAIDGANFPWFCRYLHRCRYPWSHGQTIGWLSGGSGNNGVSGVTLGAGRDNPEFFGVSVRPCRGYLLSLGTDRLRRLLDEAIGVHGLRAATTEQLLQNSIADTNQWFVYDTSGNHGWRAWDELRLEAPARFPLLRPVREEYDVMGAIAACRVRNAHASLSEGAGTNHYTIAAAAKPFGSLSGGRRVTDLFAARAFNEPEPDNLPLVLPSFSFVRLVPLGGANEGNLNNADPIWLAHANYLLGSPISGFTHDSDTCPYCLTYRRWTGDFRRRGAEYLSGHAHDEVCEPPGTAGGHSGGSHYAH